jgi:type I restriction enzyme S subunit
MNIKQGYKQTEIGIIPEEWEVKNFGDIIQYIKGFPFKSKDYES